MQTVLRTFNPVLNTENKPKYYPDKKNELVKRLNYISKKFSLQKNFNLEKRILFLQKLSEGLTNNKNKIAFFYCSESGLSQERFLKEFDRLLFQIGQYADFLSEGFKDSKEIRTKDSSYQKKQLPIGPVLVLGASNFPLAYSTAGGDTIAAFSAGCPVIFKAHPYHIGTSLCVAKIISQSLKNSNTPEWYFTHVIDWPNHRLTELLIKHSTIKAAAFTGSRETGVLLQKYVFKRPEPIPFFAEMGSLNPIVIDKSILNKVKSTFLKKIIYSINDDGGQFCTKPGIIFLPNTQKGKETLDSLIEIWMKEPFFYPIHPKIQENYNQLIKSLKVKYPKNRFFFQGSKVSQQFEKVAFLFQMNELSNQDNIFKEVFGPFSVFILYNHLDEVEEVLLKLGGQLTGSFFGKKFNSKILNVFEQNCGRIIFNDVPTGVQVNKNMHHGGPFPASSDARFTAVGTDSILRFIRPVTLQNF